MKEQKEIKLKVMEALQEEAYKGIVRIDSETMHLIGVHPGDVINIIGGRETVGIVDRAYPTDVGQNVIRMDGILRRNAKTSIGEFIVVKKAEIKEAKDVVIAPAQKGVMVKADPRIFKRALLGRAVVKGDIIAPGGTKTRHRTMSDSPFFEEVFSMFEESFTAGFGLAGLRFIIANTNPKSAVIITENTELTLNPKAVEISEERVPEVTYEDIGGLKEEISKIREMVELPLKHPNLFSKLGIDAPRGVLLYGPPGTGKTLLAKAVANESEANFILINGPEIFNKFYGETEKHIRSAFEEAEKSAPSIIFIDEIDSIAPKREDSYGELERRAVSQLLTMMDGLKGRGKVIVIAATNRANAIDPALRRPGRFDREIQIGVPNKQGRLNILKIHTRNMPLGKDVNLNRLAEITHGFVGADVAALCKEAAMSVLRRILPELKLGEKEDIPDEILQKLTVTDKDFQEALRLVRPSTLREVLIETPNIHWEDIGGLEQIKQELKEAVEWPLKHQDSFKKIGITPPRGILLYGPPGTGKTLLAKAVANESEANFILVNGPELLCVSADTKILTSHCGATTIEKFYENIMPISELVEKNSNYEVRKLLQPVYSFAIGENGGVVKTQIKTVHKLFVKDTYNLKLKNNAEVTGSANQPLLTYRDESMKWVKISEIKEGDYVAYPRRLETFDKIVQIPLPRYKHLRLIKEDADAYYVKIFSTKTSTRLPKYLTKELAAFSGWFVSEGNISEEAITICNSSKENQNEIVKLFEQFVDYDRITIYKNRVVAYSMPLVKYLEQILDQPLGTKKSHTINCPSIIAKSTKEVITAFLRTAYKGDGSISKTKVEYGSKSKSLVEGISYLIAILGIKSKFWRRKDGMFMLTISGKIEMQNFKNTVMGENILLNLRNEYNAQYHIPPISPILKRVKQLAGLTYDKEIPDGSFEQAISGRRKTGLLRLQKIMQIFEKHVSDKIKQTNEYKTLQAIAKGDFLWTLVIKKSKAKPQKMFDVETEHHSFVGGNIPLLLHNSKWLGDSEKGVRKIFEKARQSAPCVIFFDEMDSITSRRGAEAGSRVTDHMVNTLLAEMDGLQELNGVVVIGGTNRPDIIDPALLRPGRLDRLLLVPPPNKQSRLEIFKLHTKEMPLTKDIDINELAKNTEGYVGADIESVCREAGLLALREDIKAKEVSKKHFETAIKKVQASISPELMEKYKELEENYLKNARAGLAREIPSYFG